MASARSNTDAPLKTVGSYWPYAPVLFDYIHRAMPADNPQSLTPDEVYALCAYLLYLNGIVPEDAVMDAQTLPQVVMPNHAGFTSPDPAPDVFNTCHGTHRHARGLATARQGSAMSCSGRRGG